MDVFIGGLGIASEAKVINDKEDFNGEKDFNGKTKSSTCEGLLHLPTCHISIQAQTLVELVYQTLTEATTSKDNASVSSSLSILKVSISVWLMSPMLFLFVVLQSYTAVQGM